MLVEVASTAGEATAAGGRVSNRPTGVAPARQETQGEDRSEAQRKREFCGRDQVPGQRRKVLKVTRACDTCKKRKSRCSGTLPCNSCRKRGRSADCHYDAEYRRGMPVTPVQVPFTVASLGDHEVVRTTHQGTPLNKRPAMDLRSTASTSTEETPYRLEPLLTTADLETSTGQDTAAPSRGSPELDVSEIQGQYVDNTSSLAFLHRAFRRLSKNDGSQINRPMPDLTGDGDNEDSPTLTVGDKPIGAVRQGDLQLPTLQRAKELIHLYFDVCIATYRFLHLQTVESWLQALLRNQHGGMPIYQGLGRARAAIVLTILAIATAHEEKATGCFQEDEIASMNRTDSLFSTASTLIHQETARPTLESAQARIIQVLYLLTTSRMNQAWYTFGTAIQLISALGLHRRASKKRLNAPKDDYIVIQCRRRTFWTAYILDKYLGVIFGRPRHYNDEEIDQDMPESVNDEDMTPEGPKKSHAHARKDCHVDALIFHARIASILSEAAKTVYSIRQIPWQDRIAAANRLNEELQRWRGSLPPHLGSVAPSSLIPRFRRQAITLRIAYSHANMHINRLFLLGTVSEGSEPQIREAMLAANTVLETIDDVVIEGGTIFHAFWWSHYVTFCALAIVYAWEIHSRRIRLDIFSDQLINETKFTNLAERCQRHLAQATASNSPSRRYAIILDKLRREVIRSNMKSDLAANAQNRHKDNNAAEVEPPSAFHQAASSHEQIEFYGLGLNMPSPQGPPLDGMNWSIEDWQSEDWLHLDSMAFGTFSDGHDEPFIWGGNETS